MKKVLVQFDFPGVTQKQYDQVWDDLRSKGHQNPKGLLFHAGAPRPNGWVVVDLWESEDAFKKFGEVLMPLITKAGIPNIQPQILPIYYLYKVEKESVPA